MKKPPLDIGGRPGGAERWIAQGHTRRPTPLKAADYTARITIDVTPAQRARIKVAAIAANKTASELLRDLFEREFPVERTA